MSVIEASSGTYRSRVDGTIVLSVEIEPMYRADALALFGMPGTPMALAALKVGAPKLEPPKAHIGDKCWQAIDLCADKRFWEWVAFATLQGEVITSEAKAKAYILRVCGIDSRKELDTDREAHEQFTLKLFRPFYAWLESKRLHAV